MSAHPEFVKRLEDIIAEQKAVTRRLLTLLNDMSLGTAKADDQSCRRCNGQGVFVEHLSGGGERFTVQSTPCSCAAGLPFRNAAAAQERKREAQFEAQGHSRSEARRLAVQAGDGRDRAAGEKAEGE